MKTPTIHTAFYSPTGTSKKIARAITQGLSCSGEVAADQTVPGQVAAIDLTHAAAPQTVFGADAAVVFVVPVYGGKVAPAALLRMENLRGEGTPAIVAVVYGNRDIGEAATQLAAFVTQRGFVVVAAGAFVGEHSYSTDTYPIAALRPDARDVAEATAFGAKVRKKLESQLAQTAQTQTASPTPAATPARPINVAKLRAPRTPLVPLVRFIAFVVGYRRAQKRQPVVLLPTTDEGLCTHCGRCAAICPARAIARGEEERTDPARCTRCCACVKTCPVGARRFETPFSAALSRNFKRRKSSVTLL